MDMSIDIRADHLDCGARLADLIEQVADGRAAERGDHQRGCPYCRAALTELSLRWSPVAELADRQVTVPAGLHRAILARLRRMSADDRHAAWLAETGSTRVGAWVLSEICRRAARSVPGVADVHGCTVSVPTTPGTLDQPPVISPSLTLVVDGTVGVGRLTDAVRDAVRDGLARYAGLPAGPIDLTVDDLRPWRAIGGATATTDK